MCHYRDKKVCFRLTRDDILNMRTGRRFPGPCRAITGDDYIDWYSVKADDEEEAKRIIVHRIMMATQLGFELEE